MSRNVIVGLAVLVLVVLAWIAIDRMNDGTEVADAQVDAPLTTTETADGDAAVVPEVTDEPTSNADVAAADVDTAPIVEEPLVGDDAETVAIEPAEGEAAEGADVDLAEGSASLVEQGEGAVEQAADATGDALAGAADATGDALETAAEETGEAAEAAGDVAAGAGAELAAEGEAVEAETVDGIVADAEAPVSEEEVQAAEAADAEATPEAGDAQVAGATDAEPAAGTGTTADAGTATDAGASSDATGGTSTVALAEEPITADDGANVTTTTVAIEPVEGEAAATAEAPEDIGPLLTPGTFEVEPILAYIDGSDLEDAEKASLRDTVEAAGDDPSQVEAAIEELRASFEIE